MKRLITILLALVVIGGGVWVFMLRKDEPAKNLSTQQAKPFDKSANSLDKPDSIWVIVNKMRQLNPKDYAPSDLVAPNVKLRLNAREQEMLMRQEVATALEQLFAGAKKANLDLMVASAYRPYNMQQNLYSRYVAQQGQIAADTQSARPGYSEHQTGLAVDVEPSDQKCEVDTCFADTPEGKWVAANTYKYGFTLRYHEDQDDITGYMFEPWHLRYVGKALSEELHKAGDPTLEQFFGLDPAPDYGE